MLLEEARLRAHERGVEMKPGDPNVEIDGLYDHVDVADILYDCMAQERPPEKRPRRNATWEEKERWRLEEEALRAAIWEAFDAGTRGKPLLVQAEISAAMH